MRVSRRRNWVEQLRFNYTPRIVDWLVAKSTMKARVRLKPDSPIGLLVDNTVLYHAVTHETGWVSTGASHWGPDKIDTGYSARIPVHPADSKSREYANICFLPGIAHLARNEDVALYSSAELKDEQFRQPSGRYRGYGYFDYSLLDSRHLTSVDGHVLPTMGPSYFNLPSAREQQRSRIEAHRSDPIFDALVKVLGPSNIQDAWHIYTAEKHGLFCFLTMDFKLIKTVGAQAQAHPLRSFQTKVMTPEQFGKAFGLMPIPPHLFSYHDASFFVRSDIVMPNGKRRPLKNYRRNDR